MEAAGHSPPDAPIAHDRAVWDRIDQLVEEMDLRAILAHKLGPLAAARWRELGRPLPNALMQEQRAARFLPRLAEAILVRARAAYDGRMLILKGPEISALYPPGGRLFTDLDLLVGDAPAAQRALVGAGFREVSATSDEGADHHHLTPLVWPGVELEIEIHSKLNWPRHLRPPPNDVVFGAAVPARTPIDGLEAPSAAHHTVLVAAHSWEKLPLGVLRDLVDVAVTAEQADPDEVERVAAEWGLGRVWQTTVATTAWLFAGGKRPLATQLWARNLLSPRESTLLEAHARRWVTPFWMLPPGRATVAAASNVGADLRPSRGETWREKGRRIFRAAANPSRSRSTLD